MLIFPQTNSLIASRKSLHASRAETVRFGDLVWSLFPSHYLGVSNVVTPEGLPDWVLTFWANVTYFAHRTFVECKAVKAVINVGCCYNLLSEETSSAVSQSSGFPLSEGVGRLGLHLGRSARDLACQVWNFRTLIKLVLETGHIDCSYGLPTRNAEVLMILWSDLWMFRVLKDGGITFQKELFRTLNFMPFEQPSSWYV